MNQRRGLPWLLAAALILMIGLASLGTWQVQRLAWKKDLIARVQARVHAVPALPPPASEWPAIQTDPLGYEYRRLQLQGRYLHSAEVRVQALTEHGAGHWVLTPLQQADGTLVLVNRGFAGPDQRDPAAPEAQKVDDNVVVNGLLRLSEPGGGFLRHNDASAGRWHSRDVAAIATAQGLETRQVAPFFVDAEAGPPGQWPIGGLTVLKFPNSHLVYAFTWYALALMVLAAAVQLLRRQPEEDAQG
jgi:surfeit locus 1 family protein